MDSELIGALADAIGRREACALVTVVGYQGSTPRHPGARMLVYADGRQVGTIGGGVVESRAAAGAREALRAGHPEIRRFVLSDLGAICGGTLEVFIEPLAATPSPGQSTGGRN